MTRLREQDRARQAYGRVATFAEENREEYKIAVNAFAAHLIQGGLRAAVVWLQRGGVQAGPAFLEDLAKADLRGIGCLSGGDEFAAAVRDATTADYMLATRDAIAVVSWFRRALQSAGVVKQEAEK